MSTPSTAELHARLLTLTTQMQANEVVAIIRTANTTTTLAMPRWKFEELKASGVDIAEK